jgi:hypothetical protein
MFVCSTLGLRNQLDLFELILLVLVNSLEFDYLKFSPTCIFCLSKILRIPYLGLFLHQL